MNTGGGGGGGGDGPLSGGNGGSGLVVIRYSDVYSLPTIGAGLTYSATTSGGNRIITFTAGTDTISW